MKFKYLLFLIICIGLFSCSTNDEYNEEIKSNQINCLGTIFYDYTNEINEVDKFLKMKVFAKLKKDDQRATILDIVLNEPFSNVFTNEDQNLSVDNFNHQIFYNDIIKTKKVYENFIMEYDLFEKLYWDFSEVNFNRIIQRIESIHNYENINGCTTNNKSYFSNINKDALIRNLEIIHGIVEENYKILLSVEKSIFENISKLLLLVRLVDFPLDESLKISNLRMLQFLVDSYFQNIGNYTSITSKLHTLTILLKNIKTINIEAKNDHAWLVSNFQMKLLDKIINTDLQTEFFELNLLVNITHASFMKYLSDFDFLDHYFDLMGRNFHNISDILKTVNLQFKQNGFVQARNIGLINGFTQRLTRANIEYERILKEESSCFIKTQLNNYNCGEKYFFYNVDSVENQLMNNKKLIDFFISYYNELSKKYQSNITFESIDINDFINPNYNIVEKHDSLNIYPDIIKCLKNVRLATGEYSSKLIYQKNYKKVKIDDVNNFTEKLNNSLDQCYEDSNIKNFKETELYRNTKNYIQTTNNYLINFLMVENE
jgi:hypothetical protein